MRKKIGFMLLLVSALSIAIVGCGQKDTPAENAGTDGQNESRTVTLDELGLIYTTPDEWRAYETTNLYPQSLSSEGILAHIRYNYITEEKLQAYNDGSDSFQAEQDLKPICEIVVVKTESRGSMDALLSMYQKAEEVSTQGNFTYYVLSGYTGNLTGLSEEELNAYEDMAAAVPKLASSIETKEFDPSILEQRNAIADNTITFNTTTLTGEAINSTVFGGAKITMLNFGGTYAYDESAVLQQVYTLLKNQSDYQLLTAYIDTPENTANETGLSLREAADAEYNTIVMDETLANWVTSYLAGVPTTVFINQDGVIVGERLEGAKTAEEYMAAIENASTEAE